MTISYEEDFHYAAEKLPGSVVQLDGYPVYIQHVDRDDGVVIYNKVGTHTTQRCQVADLNLEPVDLGYVNLSRSASYTMRMPLRHWRQGLRDNTLFVLNGRRISATSRFLLNCVRGIYPSILDCIESVETGEVDDKAFSRRFKVEGRDIKGYRILRKEKLIGWATLADNNVNIQYAENKEYVREELEEVLNGNH